MAKGGNYVPGETRRIYRELASERDVEEEVARTLAESGEKDRLRDLLVRRLEAEGWRHLVKLQVEEMVRKQGVEHVTVEEVVQQLAPKAASMVPESVKEELLAQVQHFLDERAGED